MKIEDTEARSDARELNQARSKPDIVDRPRTARAIVQHYNTQLDAGMWRYHANRMDARRSQFDLGRVDAYI